MKVHVRKQIQTTPKGIKRTLFKYGRKPQVEGDYTIKELKQAPNKIFTFARTITSKEKEIVLERWAREKV